MTPRPGRSATAQVFQDIVREDPWHFDLPDLKFRELLFVGALKPSRGEGCYERDISRPLPLFREPDLIPSGVLFRVERRAGRAHFTLVRTSENQEAALDLKADQT